LVGIGVMPIIPGIIRTQEFKLLMNVSEKKKLQYTLIMLWHFFSHIQQQQQQQHSLFSQASWGRLEMKPERNNFKVQAH